eukprot:15289616-Ditylum_brightwellii.AAC.1
MSMSVEGITCAHCVQITETVQRGCNGNKSQSNGLPNAAVDRVLNQVLIKIDQSPNAKRIAFESARNLAMTGVTWILVLSLLLLKVLMLLIQGMISFVGMFDWHIPCACPNNGVLREDCPQCSQMNTRIFEAFDEQKEQVEDYIIGCGKKFGQECTCGPDCSCKGYNVSSYPHKQEASQAAGMTQNMHSILRGSGP